MLNWTNDKKRDALAHGVLESIEYELYLTSTVCQNNCKSGCVLHIGSWNDTAKGLEAVSKSINKIGFPEGSTLLLETMVGRGSVLGQTYKELLTVYNGVDSNSKEHVKICIDTAHVFANGQYELNKISGVDKMFSDFKDTFGSFEMLGLIHLNDSEEKFGSNKDVHARIGQGHIWGDNNQSVLVRLLDKIDELGVPTVLETVPDDYNIIKSL